MEESLPRLPLQAAHRRAILFVDNARDLFSYLLREHHDPLVQQLQEDVRTDGLLREALVEDLQQIEQSIQTCRRIFGGMLALSKHTFEVHAQGNVRRALDSALAILRDGFERRGSRLCRSRRALADRRQQEFRCDEIRAPCSIPCDGYGGAARVPYTFRVTRANHRCSVDHKFAIGLLSVLAWIRKRQVDFRT